VQDASAPNDGSSSWKEPLVLSLLTLSAEVLAVQPQTTPSQLDALREIHEQAARILQRLRMAGSDNPNQSNEGAEPSRRLP
jgi:hypothetical protein